MKSLGPSNNTRHNGLMVIVCTQVLTGRKMLLSDNRSVHVGFLELQVFEPIHGSGCNGIKFLTRNGRMPTKKLNRKEPPMSLTTTLLNSLYTGEFLYENGY